MKINKKRLILYSFIFFIIHLLLQIFSLFYTLTDIAAFDNPDIPEAPLLKLESKIAEAFFTVLSFPILPILEKTFPASMNWFNGFSFYTLFILNSIIWTLVFYLILKYKMTFKL